MLPAAVRAADWKPDPSLSLPDQRLKFYKIARAYCDSHFDAKVGMIQRQMNKPHPHLVLQSAQYAYGLLMTKDAADRKLAEEILGRVLTKQDLRPGSPTYGSFLPYYEEAWEDPTTNEDPNFGQFVGSALAAILDQDNAQGHLLSPALRKQIEEAFRHAVEFTIRRDVAPDYINICLLSAEVAAAGDKLLHVPGARDFALSKMYWLLTRMQPGTTLTEYLAPTYYSVDIGSAYGIKHFAASPEVLAASRRIIDFFWQDVASSYVAPAYNLGGPQARSYGDNMLEYAAGLKYLLLFALNGNYPLSMDTEIGNSWDQAGLSMMATAQIEPRPEFKQPTVPWRQLHIMNRPTMLATQFRKDSFMLGSINLQTVWQQQRNVVAYWAITQPSKDVGYMLDESSLTFGNGYAHFYSTQNQDAVLVALTGKIPTPGTGGLHLVFNSLADGKTTMTDPPGCYQIDDGGVTAYVYPVSANPAAAMTFHKDDTAKRAYLDRGWDNADHVGSVGVLAYLVAFKLPGEGTAPSVSNITFTPDDKGVTVSAQVNGNTLTLQAK
ncbi:MAG TPA: hypothetical protein VHY09_06790 [Candidatus Methylacidiphilales bacterium]|nr:hypothetical protein [Candidatus Methylacidiphilales bacterium]